ncbi:phosphatidylinositol 3-kinase Vps34p [Monosporozyma unispora]|nr:Phosphatidylinositol (PI) 3-kinase [Kazachstania unispora]
MNNVTYAVSQDLNVPLQIKIESLEGEKPLLKASTRLLNPQLTQLESNMIPNSNMQVSVQVIDVERDRNLTLPVLTPYIPFKGNRKWDHWVTLPIQTCQLTPACHLQIILWEYNGSRRVPFYKMSTSLFNIDDYQLKRGYEFIKFQYDDPNTADSVQDDEIYNNLNKYYLGEFNRVEWLDKLTLQELENAKLKRKWPRGTFVLNIAFPIYEFPIVYTELQSSQTQLNIPCLDNFERTNDVDTRVKIEPNMKISLGDKYSSTLKFYDPDQYNYDPIEEKYRRLERASLHSDLDKQIKPTIKKRDYLKRIIEYPPGRELTAHEKGSIWKYRYYLMNNKKALTKLLQSTNMTEESERAEALELMDTWSEIDIDDAIELLGPSFKSISVRSYAVNRLKKASDQELELYLLQLVQALCFENISNLADTSNSEFTIVDDITASQSQRFIHSVQTVRDPDNSVLETENSDNTKKPEDQGPIVISPLAEFLIKRALNNLRLGNFFYWYLKSEFKDKPCLKQIMDSFWSRLESHNRGVLEQQVGLINLLHQCCVTIKTLKDSTAKKTELLNDLLSTKVRHYLKGKSIPLPLDPDVNVVDVVSEKSKVFKSSLSPLMITFTTESNSTYQLMYKVGDDLRQDQFAIQIIRLMDELLKNENVDLKLTPYKTLAAGPQEGAIQFVPNETMATILGQYQGVLPYLRRNHADPNAELGVQDWVMDNFVKSCAGYCVITYILGVGDRHLDNLLITTNGHFFHADFGYILGQDPKPFPPLMKLPPQIIEAFGGAESSNYNKFRSYCFVAYSILRRNAGLILNLFELMKSSDIPDIRIDPDGAILKVKERFNLDISEEEATEYFQTLINDSVNALMPIVIDHLHNLAQYWRA